MAADYVTVFQVLCCPHEAHGTNAERYCKIDLGVQLNPALVVSQKSPLIILTDNRIKYCSEIANLKFEVTVRLQPADALLEAGPACAISLTDPVHELVIICRVGATAQKPHRKSYGKVWTSFLLPHHSRETRYRTLSRGLEIVGQ